MNPNYNIQMEVKLLDKILYALDEEPQSHPDDVRFFSERGPELDAGFDLRAAKDALLFPSDTVMMPLGVAVSIPAGFVGLIYPRSGLGTKKGLILGNGTGVIDAGFQGELHACLWNRQPYGLHGGKVEVKRGDRVCQLVIVPHASIYQFNVVDEFSAKSARGENGWGSTGVK